MIMYVQRNSRLRLGGGGGGGGGGGCYCYLAHNPPNSVLHPPNELIPFTINVLDPEEAAQLLKKASILLFPILLLNHQH